MRLHHHPHLQNPPTPPRKPVTGQRSASSVGLDGDHPGRRKASPGRTESLDAAHTSARIRVAASFPGRRGAGQGSKLVSSPKGREAPLTRTTPTSTLPQRRPRNHSPITPTQPQSPTLRATTPPMHPDGGHTGRRTGTLVKPPIHRTSKRGERTPRLSTGTTRPGVLACWRAGDRRRSVADGNH